MFSLGCYRPEHQSETKHKYFEGKWPRVVAETPDPSVILWKNLGVNINQRRLRGFLIYLLSTVITLLSFALIMWGFSEKEKLESNGLKSS
jgi:hypothetical protein